VNSSRATTHDEYLGGKNPKLRDVAERLRTFVKKTVPKSTEGVNAWHVPTFESNGPMCCVMVGKNHITLGFIRDTSLPDPKGLLEGTGKNLRHVKMKTAADINRPGLLELLKSAYRLNAKKSQVGMRPYRK